MPIQAEAIYARREAVLFTDLEGRIVTMNIENGEYHEFDPVGSRIWQLLEQPSSPTRICQDLMAEYAVEKETCLNDVVAFLDEIASMKLIEAV